MSWWLVVLVVLLIALVVWVTAAVVVRRNTPPRAIAVPAVGQLDDLITAIAVLRRVLPRLEPTRR